MESLEPSGGYPACHLLSPAKSTSSIDQLGHIHSKRDSAYSSFSTSSSILEYPPPGRERSASMDTISARGGLLEGMRQADIRYVKTVYDPRRGISAEYEVNSSALQGREVRAAADGQIYDKCSNSTARSKGASPRSWSHQQDPGSLELATDNLPPKVGAPLPPARSDSFAALRHRERPNSWSSLENKRFCRPPANSSGLRSSFMEEQLHTVVEKSPENSPPVKPKHNYNQKAQPGQPLLPTGIYSVPSPEPHFAQVPQPSATANGTVYPALAKESGYVAPPRDKAAILDENGNQNESSRPGFAFYQPPEADPLAPGERKPEPSSVKYIPYKVHFPSVPENEEDASRKRHVVPPQGHNPHPGERKGMQSHNPYSNYRTLKSPPTVAWQVEEEKKAPRTEDQWEGPFPEDHNANLQQRREREGLHQSLPINLGRNRSTFSSLQNIPESLRRQSFPELGERALEGYRDGRLPSAEFTKAEESSRQGVSDHRNHLDRPVSYPRPEGRAAGALASFPSSDLRYEEPPPPPQTSSSLSRRRLSPGGSAALQGFQYGKPHCSVLEKVSKIEQREQGSQRPLSVGSSSGHGHHHFRPSRTLSASAGDFEEASASPNIQASESTKASQGLEEAVFQNGDSSKQPEASWQPCGQQSRRGGVNLDTPRPSGEQPGGREARLLRSQSTFQLLGDQGQEAEWPEGVGPPTSPQEAPLSRAYRNSIKDAQSRVLGATSFRRRDLELGAPSPGTAQPQRAWRPRPASAHVGLLPTSTPSPHTPRERHSVTPVDSYGVGDPGRQAARKGPRRRLTAEQKKRSYSEPEKMNEVGISEEATPATPRQGWHGPDCSVADRRRVFERGDSTVSKAGSTLSLSGPELKQFQQSALADYIQRKTGRRPSAAPDGPPGLAPASSLCSLREPGSQARREASAAPRDRSSSFAGGRLIKDWRRVAPAPRELPGATAQGVPRPERKSAEVSAWAAAVRKAAKSMSAEDLLERSDVLAVPVHVRSRSSPIAEKMRQDVLLGESNGFGFVKDPCNLADSRSRSLSTVERGQEEIPVFTRWSGSGDDLSVPSDRVGPLDHQRHAGRAPGPRPLPMGRPGQITDPKAVPLPPPSISPSCRLPAAADPPPRREGQGGQRSLAPNNPVGSHWNSGSGLAQPPSPEQGVPGHHRRVSLPQRPPPSRVKWAPTVRADSLPEEPWPSTCAVLQHNRGQQSLPRSSSTSDPDTPIGVLNTPGRISLHISESVLQASPPPREDYDDEVFVGDLAPKATSSPTFETLPPPPPPPPLPPVDQEALDSSLEDFPPPPPQALCEAPLDSDDYLEPLTSSSSTFAKVTVAKERSMPGITHLVGDQILPSRPQTSAKGSEAPDASSLDSVPQLDKPLGQQPSPRLMPATRTQNLSHQSANGIQNSGKTISPSPQKSSEDIRTEVLAKEIVHQDKSLADILDPDSRLKTTMDLMEGLFPRDIQLLKENSVKRKATQGTLSCRAYEGKRSEDKEAVGVMVDCPTYYSVSAQKAELLSMIRDMPEEVNEDEEQADVNEKKAELIGSLTHKLESLQEAKRSLLMDIKLNNTLGEEVEALISERCKPNEFDKYKMFIGDLDKVVNLLLSLSGRLARVENVLSNLGDDASNEERNSLNEKRKVLAGQHEDARELKENLDRRERLVWDILASYLSEEQLLDYQHFVKMKSTLLIEQRKLDDKIKLGQEQIKCLLESLPSNFTPKINIPALSPSHQGQTTPESGVFPAITSPL